jgi:hypothetical protein
LNAVLPVIAPRGISEPGHTEGRESFRTMIKAEKRVAEKAERLKVEMSRHRSAEARFGMGKLDEEEFARDLMRCPESQTVLS